MKQLLFSDKNNKNHAFKQLQLTYRLQLVVVSCAFATLMILPRLAGWFLQS